ncbi:MAG: manganese catalase family protein [Acutalibacteraceae bacterium]
MFWNISDASLGTEELAHMEMICAMVHQLTRDLTPEQIAESGFAPYFVDHTNGVYPIAASGMPWTATYIQAKGDAITDLHEDLAADGAISQQQHSPKKPLK